MTKKMRNRAELRDRSNVVEWGARAFGFAKRDLADAKEHYRKGDLPRAFDNALEAYSNANSAIDYLAFCLKGLRTTKKGRELERDLSGVVVEASGMLYGLFDEVSKAAGKPAGFAMTEWWEKDRRRIKREKPKRVDERAVRAKVKTALKNPQAVMRAFMKL